jgi:hypothetical protein
MNPPTSMTRLVGTPRTANVLYVGAGLLVFGWFGGAVPWWLGIVALCSVGTVRKAVLDVRRYDAWAADWQAMGRQGMASPRPPAKPSFRMRNQNVPPWVSITIASLSLVVFPVLIAAPGADETIRHTLTLMWLGMALYLLWKLAARLRRAFVKAAGTTRAGDRKNGAATDVVAWVLPRASSSPSRADATRRLPEFSARVMTAK